VQARNQRDTQGYNKEKVVPLVEESVIWRISTRLKPRNFVGGGKTAGGKVLALPERDGNTQREE